MHRYKSLSLQRAQNSPPSTLIFLQVIFLKIRHELFPFTLNVRGVDMKHLIRRGISFNKSPNASGSH